MKKLLFMVAAVLVMVSCGSKEKNLSPEQRAENFAKEYINGVVNGDRDKVESSVTGIINYMENLGEENRKEFVETLSEKVESFGSQCTQEQLERAASFITSNIDLIERLEDYIDNFK